MSEAVDIMRKKWPVGTVPKLKSLRAYIVDQDKRLLVSDEIVAVHLKNKNDLIIPFLAKAKILNDFPSISVDIGAVKFICNGAKVMRPGITKTDVFMKGDIVMVKDEVHDKTLAVGLALEDSETITKLSKGYVIDNLHYIGDKFWLAFKQIH